MSGRAGQIKAGAKASVKAKRGQEDQGPSEDREKPTSSGPFLAGNQEGLELVRSGSDFRLGVGFLG
jgi:hypothetical protein